MGGMAKKLTRSEIVGGLAVAAVAIWWLASSSEEKPPETPPAANEVVEKPDPEDRRCQAVGMMARFMVEKKEAGMTLKRQVAEIKKNVADTNAQATMLDLADQIHTKPWANKLTPEGAYSAYYADCLATSRQK